MKRFLLISVTAMMFFFQASGQENVFLNGDKVVNLGIGFGTSLYTGVYYKGLVPPVSISYEQGIKDNVLEKGVIGVGGYLGYSSYKYEYLDWGYKYSNFVMGARGTFHYPLVDKLDTYTGLMLGFNILTNKEFGDWGTGTPNSASNGGVIWSWYIGGRYYFSETFGVMAELGYGISYLNLGISLKL